MKKVLAILLCAVMALSLVACGEESKEKQVQNDVTEVVDNNNTSTSADASLLSVVVYGKNEADVYCQLDKMPQAGVHVYFEGTPYMLIYGDVGAGLSANVCNSTNGFVLGNIPYEISDTEVVFHADMSSYADFSFESVSSYTVSIDYDGNGGEIITYAARDIAKHGERANMTDANTETTNTKTSEVEADKSVLANYAGKYTDSLGNSFEVQKDLGYGIYDLKLYSAAGWPEYSDNDGIRFYDTPIISSVKQGQDYIVVETISQYIMSEGRFKFCSDGSVEVTYKGGVLTGDFSGRFSK